MHNQAPAEYPALLAALQQQNPALAAHAVLRSTKPIPSNRVQTYTHAYQARITAAIAQDYPATQHLIGHGAFKTLSEAYLKQCPPQHWDLNTYGVGLATFMQHTHPDEYETCANTWHLACSVARLESEITRLYWMPSDATAMDVTHAMQNTPTMLSETDLEHTTFALCRTACLLQLHPKANAFLNQFRQHIAGQTPDSEWVLLSRPQWTVQRTPLCPLEAKTLEAITIGLPFGMALNGMVEHLIEAEPGTAPEAVAYIGQHLSGWMQRWLTQRALCNIHATSN